MTCWENACDEEVGDPVINAALHPWYAQGVGRVECATEQANRGRNVLIRVAVD
jgi:hypothetical protein